MSNEEEISRRFISRYGDFMEEGDTVDQVYEKVNQNFKKNGRSSLDHILGDEKEAFMSTIKSLMKKEEEEIEIETSNLDQEIFVPTGKTSTINYTESNLDYVEKRRSLKIGLRQIASELGINYNTLRGNLSKLRSKNK